MAGWCRDLACGDNGNNDSPGLRQRRQWSARLGEEKRERRGEERRRERKGRLAARLYMLYMTLFDSNILSMLLKSLKKYCYTVTISPEAFHLNFDDD